jgi:Flp pilus assembly protein TadG
MRTTRRSRGQALVEFSLVIPLILLLLLGTIDLGRAVYAYTTVAEASRQANRLAIVDQDVTRVRNEAVRYSFTLGVSHSDIDVCYKTPDSLERDCTQPAVDRCVPSGMYQREHCLAIVTTRSSFAPMTPLVNSVVPSFTVSSTSIGPIEYACPNQIRTSTCP